VGEAINLGHSEPIEMCKLIEMLEREFDRQAIIDRRPERPEDLPVTFADLEKAERLLGYRPAVPIEEGIAEYVEWFGAEGVQYYG